MNHGPHYRVNAVISYDQFTPMIHSILEAELYSRPSHCGPLAMDSKLVILCLAALGFGILAQGSFKELVYHFALCLSLIKAQ